MNAIALSLTTGCAQMGLWRTIVNRAARAGRPPDPHNLITEASAKVFTSAVQAVRSLIEQGDFTDVLGSNPDSLTAAAADIILERIYLSLHLVDRIAGRTLDAEKRSQFMDELLNEVSENVAHVMLTDKSKSNRRNFEDLFVSRYQKRLQIYTPLPIAMGNNPGTLFGEAARGIANAHFPNDTGRATLMLSIEFPLLYAQLIETLEPAMRRAAGRATA